MRTRIARFLTTTVLTAVGLCWISPAFAQLSPNMQDILRRIHTTQEFGAGGRGAGSSGRWVDGGAGYAAVEGTPDGGAEIVRYDSATGRRDVLMTAAQLTPPALGRPLQFSEYTVSADGRRMIFATNGRPTMIRKTAYDYWTLDKVSGDWRKLGAGAQADTQGLPSTELRAGKPRLPSLEGSQSDGLLYATLSPDGSRAAYVRANNLFVEDLRTGATAALTNDGSPMVINGTSDWVYEEEGREGRGDRG
jgi:dipeptidyl-peptidase-4